MRAPFRTHPRREFRGGSRSRTPHLCAHWCLNTGLAENLRAGLPAVVRSAKEGPSLHLDLEQHRPELAGHEDPIVCLVVGDAIQYVDFGFGNGGTQ